MHKEELLDFISNLPDDLIVSPIEYTEGTFKTTGWEPTHDKKRQNTYTRDVEGELVLNISFRTNEVGFFERTYENPEGYFYGIKYSK